MAWQSRHSRVDAMSWRSLARRSSARGTTHRLQMDSHSRCLMVLQPIVGLQGRYRYVFEMMVVCLGSVEFQSLLHCLLFSFLPFSCFFVLFFCLSLTFILFLFVSLFPPSSSYNVTTCLPFHNTCVPIRSFFLFRLTFHVQQMDQLCCQHHGRQPTRQAHATTSTSWRRVLSARVDVARVVVLVLSFVFFYFLFFFLCILSEVQHINIK